MIENMKIIANPPYGSKSSLAKKIIEKTKDLATDSIYLAPSNAFKPTVNEIVDYGFASGSDFNVGVGTLVYAKYSKTEPSLNKTFEEIVLDDDELKLLRKTLEYNKLHKVCYNADYVGRIDSPTKSMLRIGRWSAAHGYLNESADDTVSGIYLIFENEASKDNFKKWAVQPKKNSSLSCKYMHIINETISGCLGCATMLNMMPHLDWSREWSDNQILEELGVAK